MPLLTSPLYSSDITKYSSAAWIETLCTEQKIHKKSIIHFLSRPFFAHWEHTSWLSLCSIFKRKALAKHNRNQFEN